MARVNRVFSRRNRSSGLAGIKVGRKNAAAKLYSLRTSTANISNRFSLVLSHAVVYFANGKLHRSLQGISELFSRETYSTNFNETHFH